MKPLHFPLTTFFVACLYFTGATQGSHNFDFFGKGENSYTLQQTGYYGRMVNYSNDTRLGHSNLTTIDVDWNHWFGGGLGAGISLDGSWSGNHFTYEQLNRNWTIAPNLSYGKTLNNNWGIYARAEVLFGETKDISKTQTNTFTDKTGLFGFGGEVAFPYRIGKYTALTTSLGYNYLKSDFKGSSNKETDNAFNLGLHLEDYLQCHEMRCDPHTGFKLSADKYDQGSGFLFGETRGQFSTGTNKFEYFNLPTTTKENFTSLDLGLHGAYYIVDYIGIGGGIDFSHMMQKQSGGSNKYSWNYIEFAPEVYINAPVNNGLRNAFLKGGGYFGSNQTKITSNNNTSTEKFSIGGFNAGVGYNAFFAEQSALQICIYYKSETEKNKENDDKTKEKGWGISVGLAHAF